MRISLLTFSSIFLASCLAVSKPAVSNAGQSAPEWISGSSSLYKSNQYLVGVGNSPGQERAKEKARADLVKTISINIDATSNLKERVETQESGKGVKENISRSTYDDIYTSSKVELKNIQIADSWYNPKDEQYYALAVLPRSKARTDLMSEMDELDAETSRHLTRANNSTDIFDRIGALQKGVASQVRRKKLKSYLAAIDPAASKGQSDMYDADTLQAQTLKIQRSIPIGVMTEGNTENARTLSLYAKGGLTSSGYKPVTNGNTQYVLDVILDNEPAIYRDNAYWVFANLELKLKDTQSSKVIGTCSWQLKEGSQGKDRAVKKVLDSVKVIFDNEFDHVFKAFVSSKPCKGEE